MPRPKPRLERNFKVLYCRVTRSLDQQTKIVSFEYKEAVYNILNNILYIFSICKKEVQDDRSRSFASSLEHRATLWMYFRQLSEVHKREDHSSSSKQVPSSNHCSSESNFWKREILLLKLLKVHPFSLKSRNKNQRRRKRKTYYFYLQNERKKTEGKRNKTIKN